MKSLFLALAIIGLSFGMAYAITPAWDAYITDGVDLGGGTYANLTGQTLDLSVNPAVFFSTPGAGYNLKWSIWSPNGASPVFVNNSGWNYDTSLLFTPAWTPELKTAGLWNVAAVYYDRDNKICASKNLPFTFAPEPISASLFLLGGAGLALYRKRIKA